MSIAVSIFVKDVPSAVLVRAEEVLVPIPSPLIISLVVTALVVTALVVGAGILAGSVLASLFLVVPSAHLNRLHTMLALTVCPFRGGSVSSCRILQLLEGCGEVVDGHRFILSDPQRYRASVRLCELV